MNTRQVCSLQSIKIMKVCLNYLFPLLLYRNRNPSLQTNILDALPLLAAQWACITKEWRVNKNNSRAKPNEVWGWTETDRTGIVK
jgi:hypothetical protein